MSSLLANILILASFTIACGSASAQQLNFRLDCVEDHEGCIKLPLYSDGTQSINVEKNPVMSITESDLYDVAMVMGDNGEQLFRISLNSEATKKLAEVTAQNLNRKLAIEMNNHVFIAPRIGEAITGGSFQFPPGADGFNNIPWLKREAVKRSTSVEDVYLQWAVIFLVIFAIIIAGLLVERRRRNRSTFGAE